jgi:hypothetical protein
MEALFTGSLAPLGVGVDGAFPLRAIGDGVGDQDVGHAIPCAWVGLSGAVSLLFGSSHAEPLPWLIARATLTNITRARLDATSPLPIIRRLVSTYDNYL